MRPLARAEIVLQPAIIEVEPRTEAVPGHLDLHADREGQVIDLLRGGRASHHAPMNAASRVASSDLFLLCSRAHPRHFPTAYILWLILTDDPPCLQFDRA